jgi:hypothetical protein
MLAGPFLKHIRSAGQEITKYYETQILSTINLHSGIRVARQLHNQLLSDTLQCCLRFKSFEVARKKY